MEVGWWALIVSAGSLAVSGATFWRNRTPRPKIRITFEDFVGNPVQIDPSMRESGVRVRVENVGAGTAYKVLVRRRSRVNEDRTAWLISEQPADWASGQFEAWFERPDAPHEVQVHWYYPLSSKRPRVLTRAHSKS